MINLYSSIPGELIALIVVVAIFLLALVAMIILASKIRGMVFNKRYDDNGTLKYFYASDFENLINEPIEFVSKGNKIKGYIYKDGTLKEYKGVIVFSHGLGVGHNQYTTEINHLAKLGYLVVGYDVSGTGKSEGKTITFGVKEVKDVPLWIDYVIKNINKDAKILLGGVSMGAATVMMISNQKLPNNVKGILADCGYTSQKEIIKHYVKNMKFPPNIVYPFIKLGARIYGKFNLEETFPIEAVKKSLYPILFIHGDIDDFVPYNMSVENYNACTSKKSLATIKNADHGLAYLADKEGYVNALGDFFDEILKGE